MRFQEWPRWNEILCLLLISFENMTLKGTLEEQKKAPEWVPLAEGVESAHPRKSIVFKMHYLVVPFFVPFHQKSRPNENPSDESEGRRSSVNRSLLDLL